MPRITEIECFDIDWVNWTHQSLMSRPLSYLIVPDKPPWQVPEAFWVRSEVWFCRRKISTFISKFVTNENSDIFWVRYFHGGKKRLLTPGVICCGMEKNCKQLPSTRWGNSISQMCPKA